MNSLLKELAVLVRSGSTTFPRDSTTIVSVDSGPDSRVMFCTVTLPESRSIGPTSTGTKPG